MLSRLDRIIEEVLYNKHERIYLMVQCQGVPRLNGGPNSFFFVSPILTGNCSENPQSARGPAHCKSSLGKNMISYRPYQ